jgi:hypothetical protein
VVTLDSLQAPACAFGQSSKPKVYIFIVVLRNVGSGPVGFRRRDFVMVTTTGVAFSPITWPKSLRGSQAALRATGTNPPRAKVVGALAFDARVGAPGRLSYIEGAQVLTIRIQD